MVMTCCVPGCTNRFTRESGLEFYRIPWDPETRIKWALAIFKDANITTSICSRVCGDHFISGMRNMDPKHPDYVPSLFPSTTPQEHKVLWDEYALFRKKQEKSLSATYNDLNAVNQLWLEKGWNQDSINNLFPDVKSKNLFQTCTPNSLTSTLTQPQPSKDNSMHSHTSQKAQEKFLVLQGVPGKRKMVVRLAHPVKYGSFPSDRTAKTPKLEVPDVPVKEDKCVQFDAYIDAPEINSPEEETPFQPVEGSQGLAVVQDGSSQVEVMAQCVRQEDEDEASSEEKSSSAVTDLTATKHDDMGWPDVSSSCENQLPFNGMENSIERCSTKDKADQGEEAMDTLVCPVQESGKILMEKELGPNCDHVQYTSARDHAYHHNGINRPVEIHISKSYSLASNAILCSDQKNIATSSSPSYKYEFQVTLGQNVVKRRKCLKDASSQTVISGCKDQVIMEAERLTLIEEMLQLHDKTVARSYSMASFRKNREKVQFYSGFPNFETLKELYDFLFPHMSHLPSLGPTRFELFIFTLIKLRLGIKVNDIAYQLGVPTVKLCPAITQMFDLMYCCLSPLIDLPEPKDQTPMFLLKKLYCLKSRYFILQHVHSNLKSSDSWLKAKGVKDVVLVCDVLSRFYVAGEGDTADVVVKDIYDPFQLPEPSSEDESSESESSPDQESDSAEDIDADAKRDLRGEAQTDNISNTTDVLSNILNRQKRCSIHLLCTEPDQDVMAVDTPSEPFDSQWTSPQVCVNTFCRTISILGNGCNTGKDVDMKGNIDSQLAGDSSEKKVVLTSDTKSTISPENISSEEKLGKKPPFVLGDPSQVETPECVPTNTNVLVYHIRENDQEPDYLEKRIEIMEKLMNVRGPDKTAENSKVPKKGRSKSGHIQKHDHPYSFRNKRKVERTPTIS